MSDQTPFIKHVVLLLMENHSFDQMLGCFKSVYPDLEGLDLNQPHFNLDLKGNKIFQQETKERQMPLDPNHDCVNVLSQLQDNNSGFIKDFQSTYPQATPEDLTYIMGYYPKGFLPALHALANEFVICDHWFSSVPGPTWTNRFFALSGTSSGRVKMPEGSKPGLYSEILYQDQETIFDRLEEAKKTWKIYYYDFPLSLIFSHQWNPEKLSHYRKIDQFFKDARGPESEFPSFTFIEPKYLDIDQNDDHPPHNTMKAEKLIADVYNAVRSNAELWESTLLVVAYDEHGGFYDHVSPPAAIPPDNHKEEYTFDRLGVRVPALLISPWLGKGVEKTVFDHTSLLKFLIDKWQLNPLGARTENAQSIAVAFQFKSSLRTDTIPFIRVAATDLISPQPELEKWDVSPHHKAINIGADFLEKRLMIINNRYIKIAANFLAKFKAQIGKALIKLGKWFELEADRIRKNNIEHNCEVAERVIERGGIKEQVK